MDMSTDTVAFERNTTCWEKLEKPKKINLDQFNNRERRGWKTVRIFVSSTFKDFHYERDVLVKKVFPELRKWCQRRKLHLVECDLRWGAPKHFHSEQTLKMCLEEIDRCYQENGCPFFINMISQRIGWIPNPDEAAEKDRINEDTLRKYKLVFGLSITEMEIFHGAYRIYNPNAFFLIREDSFYDTLPKPDENPPTNCEKKKAKDDFKYDQFAKVKLMILRQKLYEKFGKTEKNPETRIVRYTARFKRFNEDKKVVFEINDEDNLTEKVKDFFKTKISVMYPPPIETSDKYKEKQLQHEAFMEFKAKCVLGRDDILQQIYSYVEGGDSEAPLLLLGGPGTGKSSIMAKAAMDVCDNSQTTKKGARHVFYHFVGAVPGSTELVSMLQRLLRELKSIPETELPNDIEGIIQMTYSVLSHPGTKPVIIFVDALNQFDEDHPLIPLINWVPHKLTDNVKCIFSLIPDTPQHKHLQARDTKPQQLIVKDLDHMAKKMIVENFFKEYTKILDDDQMKILLDKKCSNNPLWLTIACEEMRVYGVFRTMTDKIKSVKDDLLGLIVQVLSRFEQDSGDLVRQILKATLCLIEVSKHGLLESELFYILGDQYLLPSGQEEKGQIEQKEKCRYKDEDRLSAYQWNIISRALGPFLRPYGDLGEGRLDFYHRAVSKAVRKKYLFDDNNTMKGSEYAWWHSKLADYFQLSEHAKADHAFDRRVEEYPYHLVKLKDNRRLEEFLVDWETFDKLYDREYSYTLLSYWKQFGSYDKMIECYTEMLQKLPDREQQMKRYEEIGRVVLQSGEYDKTLQLAEVGLEMVESTEDTNSRLAGYYTLLADLYDSIYKGVKQLSADNVPAVKMALKYSGKSVDMLQELAKTGDLHQKKLYGIYLSRHAQNHAYLSDNLKFLLEPEKATEERFTPETAVKKGHQIIDQAIKLFDKLHDKGLLAEAKKTKGTLYRRKFDNQIKYLKEAADLCKEAYGEKHLLMAKIYNSMGTAYVEHEDLKEGWEHYIKSYEIYWEICGPEHPKTKVALLIIAHDFYVSRFGKYEGKN